MSEKKLNKVIFEHDDGSVSILEGEICQGWLDDINGALSEMQLARGRNFPDLEKASKMWKNYNKKEVRKLKLNKLDETE